MLHRDFVSQHNKDLLSVVTNLCHLHYVKEDEPGKAAFKHFFVPIMATASHPKPIVFLAF